MKGDRLRAAPRAELKIFGNIYLRVHLLRPNGLVPSQKSGASRDERGALERPFTCSFTNGDRVPIEPAIFKRRIKTEEKRHHDKF